MIKAILLSASIFITSLTIAQHQVIVLKKERQLAYFSVGDFIRYSLSGSKHFMRDQIVALTDSTIITRSDTIPSHKIKLIDIDGEASTSFSLREASYYLIAAGIILPLADFINVTAVQNETYEPSTGVIIVSSALVTSGVLVLLFKKPYVKIRMDKRLMIVDYNSPLYNKGVVPPTSP